jgi:inosose dehydratase
MIRVANAPVSYGAFERTVGILPNVLGPEQVLDAIAAAGYEGTELGPAGYLGVGDVLRERLARRGLWLAGAFVEFTNVATVLDLIEGFDAKPVLVDPGPRDGPADWDAIANAAELARERGFEPTFHHHLGTRVETPDEIEELLERTDVGLLLDTGHLRAAGGDPVRALRAWRERVNHVHLKDWRAGAFCELGAGDVDLEGFLTELRGYDGWIVVEQDWVPGPGDDPTPQIEAQARNRRWLREHAGL